MLRLGVALVVALAACGDDRENANGDDLPRDLTPLVDCRLGTTGSGSAAENLLIVAVEKMPPYVPAAFLSAEDRRFYEPGPSSIVQQVVRHMPAITQRCIGRSAGAAESADKHRRKTMQANLVARLERELTKDQILSLYLNHVYLGHGAYGVVAAAKTYFGKELARLTIAEAALLAGLAVAPTKYSPFRDLPRARERQRYVLGKMREDRHISDAQHEVAVAEPIVLATAP